MTNWMGTGRVSAVVFRRLPPTGLRIFGERERGGFSSLNRAGGSSFSTLIGSRREEEEDSLRESSPLFSFSFFFLFGLW